MSKTPVYFKEGWRPAGRGRCICPRCSAIVSTNALGRASHKCSVLRYTVSSRGMVRSNLRMHDFASVITVEEHAKIIRLKPGQTFERPLGPGNMPLKVTVETA